MKNSYDANSIQVLEGLEAIRKRPGMYIGSTSVSGLYHLVWEIIDNAVDESLAGFCDNIKITLHNDDSVTVEDNGRGTPVDVHPLTGISAARVIFTTLHAGGKFNKEIYSVSGGLHGVGASVVNALSSFMEVEIYKDGNVYYDRYEDGGNPVVELKNGKLKPTGKTDKTGTKVKFKPDPSIFSETELKWENVCNKARELSFLNPGLKFELVNEKTGETKGYFNENGLDDFIKFLLLNKKALGSVVSFSGKKEGVVCDVAMVYTDNYEESVFSFANNINTVSGGTHESGFRLALTRTINSSAREMGLLKEKDSNFRGEEVREGLLAIISVKIPEPQFEGQTKAKLGNAEVQGIVSDIVSENLELSFDQSPDYFKNIFSKIQEAKKSREAAKKAKDLVRNKKRSDSVVILSKLASCSSRDPEKKELFVVEGDSAGGSAKQARNRSFQAVLPLRGKILNVEKTNLNKLLSNNEIQTIIAAINTSIGESFNINNLNYHKIIIATDADVDGSHIRTLLLTFFFRYMRSLITEGFVYIAQPPLYKLSFGKQSNYIYSDKELKQEIANKKGKPSIQRFKGLGEMDTKQLWDTTFDPEKRILKKVTITDAIEAERVTTMLMGSQVAGRKEFIEKFADMANLDL